MDNDFEEGGKVLVQSLYQITFDSCLPIFEFVEHFVDDIIIPDFIRRELTNSQTVGDFDRVCRNKIPLKLLCSRVNIQ